MSIQDVITLEQWRTWWQEGTNVLPFLLKTEAAALPSTWSQAWEQASDYAFVLESGKDGRYTYLGLQPVEILSGKGLHAQLTDLVHHGESINEGRPLEVLKQWMAPYRAPRLKDEPYYHGGCVGFLSYDVVRSLERLPEQATDDLGLPDYLWMRLNEVWIYDHHQQVITCAVSICLSDSEGEVSDSQLEAMYANAQQQALRMQKLWQDITTLPVEQQTQRSRRETWLAQQTQQTHQTDNVATEEWATPFPQQDFEQAVTRIQEYIAQGDVFQVNLSLRQQRKLDSAPEEVYEWLRLMNPSPYMGLLRTPDFQLISGSPELLVKLSGEKISTRPIAGTRRRGATAELDKAMAEELWTNEKERAEHIMLVDLERNDIGRVAAYGSVQVPELMTIEYYSHVMHLVSQVEGRLAAGYSAYELIAATFPGGTITGAPKVRTMEIIEELEPVRRGPYTGSMGWIDYNGDMELNIIIRTLVAKDGMGYVQAGAGIVIDSDPYREYRESRSKARAVMKAVENSEVEHANIQKA